jgi:DNA-directed RNA polymerase subunit RPC12/RpoP
MNDDTEAAITALLHEIGTPPQLMGYTMIHGAIKEILNNEGRLPKMTTTLYPLLAMKYHTTAMAVERNIRHCVNSTWKFGDRETLDRLFGVRAKKPTPRAFLGILTEELRIHRMSRDPLYTPTTQVVTVQGAMSLYECLSCAAVFGLVRHHEDHRHVACPVCRSHDSITDAGYALATWTNREEPSYKCKF